MPLSEHEQRQLEQIEQALYADHPRFARAVRSADPQVHYRRRLAYAGVTFVLGIILLPVGVSTTIIAISLAGFVVMLASCYWAVVSYRRMNGIASGKLPIKERKVGRRDRRANRGKKPATGLGVRLEERWRRRQEGSS